MDATNSTARSWRTLDWLRSVPRVAIPVYQRDYRWTQGSCEQLLQDVRAISGSRAGGTHFLGSVLAKADEDGGVTLVDGQQRITTVQLLLAAVARASSGETDSPLDEVHALLTTPTTASRTRLQPHERFEAEFRHLLLGSDDDVAPSSLSDNLAFLLPEVEKDWRAVWAGLLRLEHVTISLGPDSNAQQIFESLNATGARLSDDELIHNYVHMGRTRAEQALLERDTWIPIEEATAGHTRAFWRDYLVLTAETVPDFSGEFGVFEAFKRRYPDPTTELTAPLQEDWKRYADLYGILLQPEREKNEQVRNQLRLLQTFGGAPRPFVLMAYRALQDGTSGEEQTVEILEALQSLFIRRAVVDLERDVAMVWRLCRDRRDGVDPLDALVRRTPEDPAVRLALTHGSIPHATYVLRRLLHEDRPDVPGRADLAMQVEHIHPQKPTASWSGNGPRVWGLLSNEEQARYRSLLDTIGNLTLLEAHLNQGAGNRSLALKGAYYRLSAVAETQRFATTDEWNDAAIRSRTERLAARFLRTWRRPSGTPMTVVDELIKAVDLARTPLRGYPVLFDHAEFDGAVWGGVHTSKQLLVHLVDELIRRDPARLATVTYGDLVKDVRAPKRSQERLADGRWLYTGWAHRYLIEVVQSLLTDFGLEDSLRVKMAVVSQDG